MHCCTSKSMRRYKRRSCLEAVGACQECAVLRKAGQLAANIRFGHPGSAWSVHELNWWKMMSQKSKVRLMSLQSFIAMFLFTCSHVFAAEIKEAITPYMGWNTWNFHKCDINELIVTTAAMVLKDSRLASKGYNIVWIGEQFHQI